MVNVCTGVLPQICLHAKSIVSDAAGNLVETRVSAESAAVSGCCLLLLWWVKLRAI